MNARHRLLLRESSRLALLLPVAGLALLAWPADLGWPQFLTVAAPFVLLAPAVGLLPRRAPLVAALVGIFLVAVLASLRVPWMAVLGCMAAWYALFTPAHVTARIADAEAAGWSLVRVNGITAALAAVVVWGLTVLLREVPAPEALTWHGSIALGALAVLVVGVCIALPATTPETKRSNPLRGWWLVLTDAEAWSLLLASALFQASVLAGVAFALTIQPGQRLHLLSWGAAGLALGSLLGGANGHPVRSLGRIPLGMTGLALVFWWIAPVPFGYVIPVRACLFLGVLAGVVSVPLRAAYQQALPEEARTHGLALGSALTGLLGGMFVLHFHRMIEPLDYSPPGPGMVFTFFAFLALLGAILAWRKLFVPTIEMLAEWLLTPMYRVRAEGPGARRIPRRGPVLIVANHAAWGDPFWIAKIAPRHVRPMMISRFFDLPAVRWLMVHVVGAIRVHRELIRHETPELDEAIAVLRNGECLAIFPEGSMRRDEEHPLRPFGQGVWHILSAVPQTPVVVCWIEGGWGSYTSYLRGPPTKNKRVDWRRLIRIGVAKAEVLPADLLADRQRTRDYLHRRCLECRRFLGLDVPLGSESSSPPEGEGEKE